MSYEEQRKILRNDAEWRYLLRQQQEDVKFAVIAIASCSTLFGFVIGAIVFSV